MKTRPRHLIPPRLPMSVARALTLVGTAAAVACGVSDQRPGSAPPDPVAVSTPVTGAGIAPTIAPEVPIDRRLLDAPLGYGFERLDNHARAVNATQGISAVVDADAVTRITPAPPTLPTGQAWEASLQLEGVGRGHAVSPAPHVTSGPTVLRGSARLTRGQGIEEWYADGPMGIEHGFVLAQPPSPAAAARAPGMPDAPLVLEIGVTGSLRPVRTSRTDTVSLQDDAGRPVLSYGGLLAWDADGVELPSWLDLQGSSIQLVVDDRGARYPLTIDPIIWVLDQKLVQDGIGTVNDQLGLSVALSGDTAIVGAFGNDENGLDAGAAYVYTRVGTAWVQQQKLMPTDSDAGDYFGYSVAIDGDTAIIGAYGDDESSPEAGAAYVFLRSGGVWTQHKKLIPTGAQSMDYFGVAVALQGDAAIVGAHGDDEKGSMAGAAYIFRQNVGGTNAWGQQTKLTADAAAEQDQFGIAVAIDGTTALVGASGDDEKGSMAGAAYAFVRSGSNWTQEGKLVADDGAPLDKFGSVLSVHGDTVAVGASLANTPAADAGAAYVFVRSGTTWTQQQKIVAADAEVQDYFGGAVSVRGDRLLVGAWGDELTGANAGAAYVYERTGTTWTQQLKFQSTGIAANDWFGIAVALGDTTALIGATGEDDTGSNAGAAFAFEQDGADPAVWAEQGKLLALDGFSSENLGYAVAIDGNTAVAGAFGADDQGPATGAAYVYAREASGWSQQARLTAPDGATTDRFGFAVELSGDTVVVGAYQHDGVAADEGAAYVFVRSGGTWSQQAKLKASDAAATDYFGVAVAAGGDTIAVGAHADDDGASNAGSVYVFDRTGTAWTQTQKLTASDRAANDNFGRAIAMHGDTLLVGSPNDDDGASNAGSVYVFERVSGTWSQTAKLVATAPGVNAYLGFSVAIDGDTALAGAYRDSTVTTDQGSAFVFVRASGTWSQQARLDATDGATTDRFGQSVAIFGDLAAVGSPQADPKGSNSGATYVFGRSGTTWTEQQKLEADDGVANDAFGFAVAMDATTVVSGAYGDDDRGGASGAVYALALRKTLGEACGGASECVTGHCVDGACCAQTACPDCHSCAAPGSEGQCTAMPSLQGSACGDTADSDCTNPDTCDGQGVCQPNHVTEGTACGSDESTACTEPDSCDGAGTCLPNHVAEATPCGDDGETECTDPDTCNGEGTCVPNHLPDGTDCTGGVCAEGLCSGDGGAGGAAGSSGSGGTGGASGTGGDSGSGGTGGSAGTGGTGGGTGGSPAASGSDSDGGCGCRTTGSPARGGLLASLLLLMAAVSRRGLGFRLRKLLPACVLLPFVPAAGCGDDTDVAVSTGGSNQGGSGGVDGGPGGEAGSGGIGGTGGTSGTGATGGGPVCPPENQCGLSCCTDSQECVDGQCLDLCPAPRERCGDPPVCCETGEQCYKDECVTACTPPTIPCGQDELVCCDATDVCFNNQCVVPGGDCIDFADCDDDEYCEPTVGRCLPASALPACEYRPPVGEFQPLREWSYSPVTAPYVRDTTSTAAADVCAQGFPLAFANPDEALAVVPLGGLTFPFFDKDRTALVVSTNGWLTLDANYAGGAAPDNTALLSSSTPDLIVAPYWDDLKNVTACALVDKTLGRVVVQWRGEVGSTGEWVRFQAILHAKTHTTPGVIELKYMQLGSTQDGDGATIGIAEVSTGRAIQHGLDRNGAVSTTASLRFRYVPLRNRFDTLTGPAIFDLDGDGKPEVIFPAYDDTPTSSGVPNDPIFDLHSGVLTILNGEDGTIQARPFEIPGYDGYLGAGVALSVGDLDGDGKVEIVGVGRLEPMLDSKPYVKAFNADGTLKWVSNVDVGFAHNGWGGGVHIADLDGDGRAEIFFGLSVFNHEGMLLWTKPVEYGSPATTAADLDDDGDLEVVSDRSAWQHDGTPLWQRTDLSAYHFPSIADFDLDGTPEVALVSSGSIIILNGADGTTFWGPVSLQTDGGGPLNIGDFDADGYPEIGTAGEGLYLVIDLQCVGSPLPAGCDREGVRWSSPTKDISSNVTGSSLFDFEGDGFAEVVYSDECFTRVYSGMNGHVLFESSVNTRTATEYPLVADVDGDNNAEIIVTANENVVGCNTAPWSMGMTGVPWKQAEYPPPFCTTGLCGHRGLAVYGDALDNWVRTRRVWSGHAYHITNVLSSGAIPQQEERNWTNPRYNNFRMNAQGAALFSAPDLQVELEVDPLVCPLRLRLRANVANRGAIGVSEGVDVAFYKQEGTDWVCLGVVQTAVDLLPGDVTEVTLDYTLDNEMDTEIQFRAVVDSTCQGDGQHNECEVGGEDNNEDTASGLCSSVLPPA